MSLSTDSSSDHDRLVEHLAWAADRFNALASRAGDAEQAGDLRSAVVWAQIAADFAWHRHPGFYVSPFLESLLLRVATSPEITGSLCLPDLKIPVFDGDHSKTRILHVITKAYATGGHTRLIERLINNTTDRYVHSIVGTEQESPLPPWLSSAVTSSGGWYKFLPLITTNLLKRARILRQFRYNWADIVFLHTHPSDALPTVSFGIDGGPPVLLVNHADHVFGLGSTVADVFADLRLSGQAVSRARRGARISKILPIPLIEPPNRTPDSLAREKLHIDRDSVILLTIASSYKYTAFGGYDFIATVTEVVARHKQAILLVVGPKAQGRWLEASRRVEGRIRVLGRQNDLRIFHDCADIYLDSFPFASLTSMLDVGLRGLPVIGLRNPDAPIYTDLDLTLGPSQTHVGSRDEYLTLLGKMIEDEKFRHDKGRECRERIRGSHLVPGWDVYLRGVMAALPKSHRVNRPLKLCGKTDANDTFLAGFNDLTEAGYSVDVSIGKHARLLPFAERGQLLLQGLRKVDGRKLLPLKAYLGEFPRFLVKSFLASLGKK